MNDDSARGCAMVLLLGLLIAGLLFASPFALLWAVYTISDFAPSYDWQHWFAALLIILLLAGSSRNTRDHK